MDKDLEIIDCVEKLRSHLLGLNPDFGRKREELLVNWLRINQTEFVLEAYLAVCLKKDMRSASVRRTIHSLLKDLKSSVEASRKEDFRDFGGIGLAKKEREKLQSGLQKMESLLEEGALKKALETGAQNAVNLLWSKPLGLSGLRAYRFLHLTGAPVVIPGSAKLMALYRLGWLRSHKAVKETFRAFQIVCE